MNYQSTFWKLKWSENRISSGTGYEIDKLNTKLFKKTFFPQLVRPSPFEGTFHFNEFGDTLALETKTFDQPAYSPIVHKNTSQESASFGTNDHDQLHHDPLNDDDVKYLMQTLGESELKSASDATSSATSYPNSLSVVYSDFSTSRQRELFFNFEENFRILKRIEDILNDENRVDRETAMELKALVGLCGPDSFNYCYLSASQSSGMLVNDTNEQKQKLRKWEEYLL